MPLPAAASRVASATSPRASPEYAAAACRGRECKGMHVTHVPWRAARALRGCRLVARAQRGAQGEAQARRPALSSHPRRRCRRHAGGGTLAQLGALALPPGGIARQPLCCGGHLDQSRALGVSNTWLPARLPAHPPACPPARTPARRQGCSPHYCSPHCSPLPSFHPLDWPHSCACSFAGAAARTARHNTAPAGLIPKWLAFTQQPALFDRAFQRVFHRASGAWGALHAMGGC